MTLESRIKELEAEVANLKAHSAAYLLVLQILILRCDDATFRTIIELLDFPLPLGMGETTTRESHHLLHQFTTHLLALRERMSDTDNRQE